MVQLQRPDSLPRPYLHPEPEQTPPFLLAIIVCVSAMLGIHRQEITDILAVVQGSDDPLPEELLELIQRPLITEEDKRSILLNELYKKRIISEKRMINDYMRREREWRRAESKKPSEINEIYIWNKQREEREKNKNKYKMATNQLYGFF